MNEKDLNEAAETFLAKTGNVKGSRGAKSAILAALGSVLEGYEHTPQTLGCARRFLVSAKELLLSMGDPVPAEKGKGAPPEGEDNPTEE